MSLKKKANNEKVQRRRRSEYEMGDNRIRIERYLLSNKRKELIQSILDLAKEESIQCAVYYNFGQYY